MLMPPRQWHHSFRRLLCPHTRLFHLAQAYLKVNDRERARKNLEAAKTRGGLPAGLHQLEQTAYQRVLSELGTP